MTQINALVSLSEIIPEPQFSLMMEAFVISPGVVRSVKKRIAINAADKKVAAMTTEEKCWCAFMDADSGITERIHADYKTYRDSTDFPGDFHWWRGKIKELNCLYGILNAEIAKIIRFDWFEEDKFTGRVHDLEDLGL